MGFEKVVVEAAVGLYAFGKGMSLEWGSCFENV